MLKEHQHPVVKFMLCWCILCASERGTGDRVIRIVGWPRVHCVPPRCSPLSSSRPVVGLAQALLSRSWHRGEPVAKEDLVRGGGKSAHAQQQLFEYQAPPTSNHALPPNPPCACKTSRARPSRDGVSSKYNLKVGTGKQRNKLSIMHRFQNTCERSQQS